MVYIIIFDSTTQVAADDVQRQTFLSVLTVMCTLRKHTHTHLHVDTVKELTD